MDQFNNNFNENQNIGFNSNPNQEQNFAQRDMQMNQADIYAPYNQPQDENSQESQPQQNTNQQNFYGYNVQQNNQYPDFNQQQPYNQSNPYYGKYNQQPYNQNNQYNQYGDYNQPPQYNAPYYNQQYPIYNFQEKTKGFAIASLILGICSTLGSCCVWFLTLVTSITGLILGIVSLKRNEGGKGMAVAGIILSAVGILFSIFTMIIFIFGFAESRSYINSYDPYYFYN